MVISKNTTIGNIVNSDIKIINDAILTIRGIVNGSIYVSDGSECIIHGIVNGSINNQGAVTIYGIANISDHNGYQILVKSNAIINGKHYFSDELI